MSTQDLHKPNGLVNGSTLVDEDHSELSPAEQLDRLAQAKASSQAKLDACYAVLQVNHATMQTPLVDGQGFPRADLDVASVRTVRAEIIRTRNDLTEITNKMAVLLEVALARRDEGRSAVAAPTSAEVGASAFVRVDGVFPGGPADEAGLKREDLIVAFGSVTSQTNTPMSAVATLVATSQNVPLLLKVTRPPATDLIELTLTPRANWGGRGLLGCHIVPL